MDKELIQHLDYAINTHKMVYIDTKNSKRISATIEKYDQKYVHYLFYTGSKGKIFLKNIVKVTFLKEEEIEFNEMRKRIEESQFENFREYFLEIVSYNENHKKKGIENSEKEGDDQGKGFKAEVINHIFDGLKRNSENICNLFFEKRVGALPEEIDLQEILLLQQSNLSQKRCIEGAIKNQISVIEGPPGTGKTTTILSIIANLVKDKKKVVVISKNNSAINNIVEELDNLDFPEFYVRLGNKDIMKELQLCIDEKVERYAKQIDQIEAKDLEKEKQKLTELRRQLATWESELNDLVLLQNQYDELQNQNRHLQKRLDAYEIDVANRDKYIKRVNRNDVASKLRKLNSISSRIDKGKKIGIWERVCFWIEWKIRLGKVKERLVGWQLILEYEYLMLKMNEIAKRLEQKDIQGLKKKINNVYTKEYTQYSREVLIASLKEWNLEQKIKQFQEHVRKLRVEEESIDIVKECKQQIIDMYPVILTTVDSMWGNFWSYIKDGRKIDYIIMDEASQCDLLSAIPMMYLAERMVVVGDSKQLSAITQECVTIPQVPVEYDYRSQSFLDAIIDVFHPEMNVNRNILLEHYRCDFKIINYCNKYFYNNELIIYKNAQEDSMEILDVSQGKYVEPYESSFRNEREIVSIDALIGDDLEHKFVITPYKQQGILLKEKYNKEQCGTIHTFQGKGDDEVYFSTVLNDIDEARAHLQGKHNMFTNELINVAVSRAKNKFVLVSDTKFLKQNDENMKNLIEYMEAYGNEIPDKTVCVFDGLYKEMYHFTKTEIIDNPFEEAVLKCVEKYLEKMENLECIMKILMADVVTDKKYLDSHIEIKRYISNNAHLDFTIYDKRIGKPVLVIELDGKDHNKPEQVARDRKKEAALDYMGIRWMRIRSKEAFTEEDFSKRLEETLRMI